MTRRDAARKWGPWVGLLVGLTILWSTLLRAGDTRYVQRTEYEKARVADSLKRDLSDSVLHRIDARVSAIYCGSLPADHRAGCQ